MRRWRTVGGAVVALVLTACTSPAGESTASLLQTPGENGALFFAQNAVPNAFMEALFEGRVAADDAGCLRLDGPDAATVVWPYRSRLVLGRVLDSLGVEIGRIGGSFRLGGGEVALLHSGIAISQGDRALAEARCPGRYWIVGQV